MRRSAVAAALALALPLAALPARAAERRLALVIGQPDGGSGTVALRYAERDARRMHAVLTRLGGVRGADARLLLSPGAAEVRRGLGELAERSREARAQGGRTVLLVYYSGHAKDGALRLRETRLELSELKRLLEEAPADVRIGLIDSCRSGAITRAKGVRRAPAFEIARAEGPRGLVLVTSSGADEDSQESDAIGGSFFTHHLASGLMGDADSSGDGKVTLAEAYAYAYARTVASTADTAAGVQHPAYLYDLGGAGDVVLTEFSAGGGVLVFPAAAEGSLIVLDRSHRAVAEVAKSAGAPRRLALPTGRYTVKKRLAAGDGLLVQDLELASAPVQVDEAQMRRLPLSRDPQKGFGGSRWSLLAGLGGQRFFGPSAASGLFPSVALGGVELMIRDDLGHGLTWGLDAALGGGSSALAFSGDSVAMRIGEVSGGGTIGKDFRAGPVTLSAGARLAFIYLTRSFPDRPDLPSQYFFTITPGVTAAATWRFSERFAAVARARGHYLFYNVDRNMSLGYAELLLGVEYAFGN
jgi:hypothetical protein